MIDWVDYLGGNEVTLYAFSIENFKRSRVEVDGLMEIFRGKFKVWLEEKSLIFSRKKIRFRLFGDLSLLPPDIQQLSAKLTLATESHDR